ncbi:hypothetical protein Sam46_gp45 [Bacillus phage vB_BcM_Sam46]|uniref:Uncharacterized protein n=2 Tax=Caudoviricetes TaxID=2731619 RepID=A0A6G9L9B3_9CAUD|nr:hypothetical protein Sam112_gp43 [Bacillus phage vB_BcM_Sam112]QIQ61246.1 hypothetical protein Sam46_gp45 [Bacillus phage vB_BcM_Sam46]
MSKKRRRKDGFIPVVRMFLSIVRIIKTTQKRRRNDRKATEKHTINN